MIEEFARTAYQYEFDLETVKLQSTGKWFVADPRQYEHQDYPWYCVHGGSVSVKNVLATLARVNQWWDSPKPVDLPVFVFEARNLTEARQYLQALGYATDYRRNAMPEMMSARERKIAAAKRRIEKEQERIDYLSSLPDEPTPDPDGANVIWFRKRFTPGGTDYTYAAVQTPEGTWYTTGPRTPKAYTWEDLVEWIFDDNPDAQVWVAATWEPLS